MCFREEKQFNIDHKDSMNLWREMFLTLFKYNMIYIHGDISNGVMY